MKKCRLDDFIDYFIVNTREPLEKVCCEYLSKLVSVAAGCVSRKNEHLHSKRLLYFFLHNIPQTLESFKRFLSS